MTAIETSFTALCRQLESHPWADVQHYVRLWNLVHYVFMAHKHGILVLWAHGKITAFTPFSNENFDNRVAWATSDLSERRSGLRFVLNGVPCESAPQYYATKTATTGVAEAVKFDQRTWWLNGHLLCNTAGSWSARNVDAIRDSLEAAIRVLAARAAYPVGGTVFNRRDFPLRSSDAHTSTFAALHGGHVPEAPLWYGRDMAVPISYYGGAGWQDELWPVPEQWDLDLTLPLEPVPWHKRIGKAVFRGTLTGSHFDERNPRVALVRAATKRPDLFDCGLTAWSLRDRVDHYTVHFSTKPADIRLVERLSPEQQARYKVIVYVAGHVASSRLAWHLYSGCAIVWLKGDQEPVPDQFIQRIAINLFKSPIQDGVHYVSATASTVIATVEALLRDDTTAMALGAQAKAWAVQHLSRQNMLDYCASILGRSSLVM